MELIRNNPYRVIGVFANATERELHKQKAKINAYVKARKKIRSDLDFKILGNIDRTKESVSQAFSDIEQNRDRVNYVLFWFLNISPFDNAAFEYLKNGNEKKAIEIWEKITTGKDVNSKNFSAFNNLGTIKLLSSGKLDIEVGIKVKIKLIESGYFQEFVRAVTDQTFRVDNQRQIEKFIDELLKQFKNRYSNSEVVQLFSSCSGVTKQYLLKRLTEDPLYRIERWIVKI